MLGECLKELEESHDQHAVLGKWNPSFHWLRCFLYACLLKEHGYAICFTVDVFFGLLVLQPAVEAFFLVHATERESKPPVRDTRESQLSHIKDEPPPLSPAPLTPATPSSLDPFFSREPSSMHISSNLPPDTQKFLRFAGEHGRLQETNKEKSWCVAQSLTGNYSSSSLQKLTAQCLTRSCASRPLTWLMGLLQYWLTTYASWTLMLRESKGNNFILLSYTVSWSSWAPLITSAIFFWPSLQVLPPGVRATGWRPEEGGYGCACEERSCVRGLLQGTASQEPRGHEE